MSDVVTRPWGAAGGPGGPGPSGVGELVEELGRLRRGHGLHAADLGRRLGPVLRGLTGLPEGPLAADGRLRLIAGVERAVATLPPEPRIAVQAALALPPAAQSRLLRERMEWLAGRLRRDPRTAARRVSAGLLLLAEQLLTDPPAPGRDATAAGPPPAAEPDREGAGEANAYVPEGWQVPLVRSLFRLDSDPVRLVEQRTVLATTDALDRVTLSWSVPRDPRLPAVARAQVHLESPGRLEPDHELTTPTFWTGHVVWPRPLRAGEQADYRVVVTAFSRRYMRRYYALSPHRPIGRFELSVQFDPLDAPRAVWRLGGVPVRLVDEARPGAHRLTPDETGLVRVVFEHLRPGLSYGVQWSADTV